MRPTVRSRRLGTRLNVHRQGKGLSGAVVAGELGVQQPHWSKIETGKARISPEHLKQVMELFDVPVDEREALEKLRQRAEEQGWWQDYGDVLSEPVQMLIELEAAASRVSTYQGSVVPGLLQTRRYAERIITAGAPHLRIGDIDRYLELRMRRQRRLQEGMQVRAVVSEAVVRWRVGGVEIYTEQLRHLIAVTQQHDVTIQVVPFTADAHAALGDQFAIIEWADEQDPQSVYVDGQTSWTVHERVGLIRQYLHAFASAQTAALPVRDSLVLIESLIEELE
ncbi:helix-turn-helix domain-containing protein [Pseudonocardia spinosispora]|uniref:helix-turn-helix domain-containing protein n=1 Tax=Pseudonocardia spinosispora TaxID=103441 RepID=UPI00048D5DC7|nr:helix-turn-helix transcriptional regulator [Pseudonocardia spinosispora]